MSLKKSSFFFSAGTLLSRFSGLARDAVLSRTFGAGPLMDSFNIAFRIPNLFRDMLAEGALGSSFTKVYSEKSELNKRAAQQLLIGTLQAVLLILSIVTALGIIFSPQLVQLMTLNSGENYSDIQSNAASLTRLLFPFLAIASINAVLSGVLHQKGSFFTSALSPIIGNLGYIVGSLFLAQWFRQMGFFSSFVEPGILGLAVGVMLGAGLQLIGVLAFARHAFYGSGWSSIFSISWGKDVKRVFLLSLPMALAASVGPINGFINTNFASSIGPGAVSWLVYAFKMLQLPVGLFGVAVGVVALPTLTRSIARNDGRIDKSVIQHLEGALGLILLLMAACFAFYSVNHYEVIALFFEHGEFSHSDAVKTGRTLFAYSFGLVAYGFIKVLVAFYYAIENTKYPMRASIFGVMITFVASYILVEDMKQVGLALASSIALSCNGLLLLVGLRAYRHEVQWTKVVSGIFTAALACGLAIICQLLIKSYLLPKIELAQFKVDLLVELTLSGITVVFAFLATLLAFNGKKIFAKFYPNSRK